MNYEQIYRLASGLVSPVQQPFVIVEWIVPNCLAIGRDSAGRHLLLLAGVELRAKSQGVERVLARGRWRDESGSAFDGTLLHLHQGEPFLVAATTIAAELMRRGVDHRAVPDVFQEVEPFIELVIRRILLPPNSLLGLVGELIVLDYALDALATLPEPVRPSPISVWRGYTNQSRDFAFKRLAIEVKTTSGHSSRHHIGSLDQVEARSIDGGLTEALFLVSIGLTPAADASGRFSVSQLTARILGKVVPEHQSTFLDQLRAYGPDDCVGYDHNSMSVWEPYRQRFRLTFEPRVYDMSDPKVRVLRRSDLQELFVVPEGLSYTIDLPSKIPGSYEDNPRVDLGAELVRLMALYA